MDLLARHKSTFLLWAPVQFTEPSLAEVGRLNLSRYQGFIVERLAAAGAHPPTPNTVPIGILSIVQWSYFDFLARHPDGLPPRSSVRWPSSCIATCCLPPGRQSPSGRPTTNRRSYPTSRSVTPWACGDR